MKINISDAVFDKTLSDAGKRIVIEALGRYSNDDFPDDYERMTDPETNEVRLVMIGCEECRHCHTKDVYVIMGWYDNVVAQITIKP